MAKNRTDVWTADIPSSNLLVVVEHPRVALVFDSSRSTGHFKPGRDPKTGAAREPNVKVCSSSGFTELGGVLTADGDPVLYSLNVLGKVSSNRQ